MLLQDSKNYDFEMKYYNSDGNESTMCGNGGRCIVSFAYDIGIKKSEFHFIAIDGPHSARILDYKIKEKTVELGMIDVSSISNEDDFIIDTGSPHHLNFSKEIKELNVFEEGKKIRYSDKFKEEGINVNFIEEQENKLFVRTYERGVENETLACGTGVTASAIASSIRQGFKYQEFFIKTLGGDLKVKFDIEPSGKFTNVKLTGPATFVFKGEIDI
jgi:diaminopimelate epimerase